MEGCNRTSWQEEIMTEQSGRGLQIELHASREKSDNSEAGQRLSIGTPHRRRLRGFSRKLLLGALPATLLLAAGGQLYGQDASNALFIDKDGNAKFSGKVGIGPTNPEAKLDVQGTVRLGRGIAESWFPYSDNNAYISGKETIVRSDSGGSYTEFVRINKDGATVSGGKIQLDGNQQVKFKDADISNNLKLQLWSGYGLGINGSTLFYAANGRHSWRDNDGTNERMALTTGADGGLTVNGTGNSSFAGNLGVGTTDPKDKLDVAGPLRILTGSNPIRFSSGWSSFPDSATNQAEISNDTSSYKTLMIAGNKSGGGTTRRVTIYDQLEVNGATFARGPLNYYWGPDKVWKNVQNRANDFAGSYGTGGPSPSDLRLKTDLKTIPSALDKVRSLRAVTYRWNETALQYFTRDIETTFSAGPNATKEENQKVWQAERTKQYKELSNGQVGVVAQDVEAVLPEAVSTDEAGYKSVRYQFLIPLLIAALKEQDKAVKDQNQIISQQQQEITRLEAANLAVQQQLAVLSDVRAQVARLGAMLGSGDAGRSFVAPRAAISLTSAQP
jgi:hypothetical protein